MPRYEDSLPEITARRLFDPVTSPPGLIRLGDHQPNWYRFANGYRLAADKLATSVNEHGAALDYVCFPILFLYRHSIELYLKAMLLDLDDLLDEEELILGYHDLVPLWERFRERLLEYDPSQDSAWLTRSEQIIRELDTVDHRSYSFRYPVDKKGFLLLAPDQGVNVGHFASVIEELDLVLDGASAWLDEHLDLKRGMEPEYSSEYYG